MRVSMLFFFFSGHFEGLPMKFDIEVFKIDDNSSIENNERIEKETFLTLRS